MSDATGPSMTVGEEVGQGPPQVPDTCPGPASRFCIAPAQPLFHTLPSQLSGLPDSIPGMAPPSLGLMDSLIWDAHVGFVAIQMDKG